MTCLRKALRPVSQADTVWNSGSCWHFPHFTHCPYLTKPDAANQNGILCPWNSRRLLYKSSIWFLVKKQISSLLRTKESVRGKATTAFPTVWAQEIVGTLVGSGARPCRDKNKTAPPSVQYMPCQWRWDSIIIHLLGCLKQQYLWEVLATRYIIQHAVIAAPAPRLPLCLYTQHIVYGYFHASKTIHPEADSKICPPPAPVYIHGVGQSPWEKSDDRCNGELITGFAWRVVVLAVSLPKMATLGCVVALPDFTMLDNQLFRNLNVMMPAPYQFVYIEETTWFRSI